ncbi:laminin G sub domain 2 [Seminavis robusta]|uniref:Laminin G sub domain 2 n=1 Tax=Seminavis robusta TaxID=568900 RepID=A0A9N8E8X3_9STRA|nr:laminin G sub domain 2 [Seminavis robusta]|eukprot:Sro624_g177270.1 laminin G sub domain 2 (1430) ;mRNA; r:7177-11466
MADSIGNTALGNGTTISTNNDDFPVIATTSSSAEDQLMGSSRRSSAKTDALERGEKPLQDNSTSRFEDKSDQAGPYQLVGRGGGALVSRTEHTVLNDLADSDASELPESTDNEHATLGNPDNAQDTDGSKSTTQRGVLAVALIACLLAIVIAVSVTVAVVNQQSQTEVQATQSQDPPATSYNASNTTLPFPVDPDIYTELPTCSQSSEHQGFVELSFANLPITESTNLTELQLELEDLFQELYNNLTGMCLDPAKRVMVSANLTEWYTETFTTDDTDATSNTVTKTTWNPIVRCDGCTPEEPVFRAPAFQAPEEQRRQLDDSIDASSCPTTFDSIQIEFDEFLALFAATLQCRLQQQDNDAVGILIGLTRPIDANGSPLRNETVQQVWPQQIDSYKELLDQAANGTMLAVFAHEELNNLCDCLSLDTDPSAYNNNNGTVDTCMYLLQGTNATEQELQYCLSEEFLLLTPQCQDIIPPLLATFDESNADTDRTDNEEEDEPTSGPSAIQSAQPGSLQPTTKGDDDNSPAPSVVPSWRPTNRESAEPSLGEPTSLGGGPTADATTTLAPTSSVTLFVTTDAFDGLSDAVMEDVLARDDGIWSNQPTASPVPAVSTSSPSATPSAETTLEHTTTTNVEPTPDIGPTDQPTSNSNPRQETTTLAPTALFSTTAEPSPTPTQAISPTEVTTKSADQQPSVWPSMQPSFSPTPDPTSPPTPPPTPNPTRDPTSQPTPDPTSRPTSDPTSRPTPDPTRPPTPDPTSPPTPGPTTSPTTSQPSPTGAAVISIVNLILVDATTRQDIHTISTGDVIRVPVGSSLTVRAQPSSRTEVESVDFYLDGEFFNNGPWPSYAMNGHSISAGIAYLPVSELSVPMMNINITAYPNTTTRRRSLLELVPMQVSFSLVENVPTATPSGVPSSVPSMDPSNAPSLTPSARPSSTPSTNPSFTPSSWFPSISPSKSDSPSLGPLPVPSRTSSIAPSTAPPPPTAVPSKTASIAPSTAPSTTPSTSVPSQTGAPTNPTSGSTTPTPSVKPTNAPTANPSDPATSSTTAPSTGAVTTQPTAAPTASQTAAPSPSPSSLPAPTSSSPTKAPTDGAAPTNPETGSPTSPPTFPPTFPPTSSPSTTPTTSTPSGTPTATPSNVPSSIPSNTPSSVLSMLPSSSPSSLPSSSPSSLPTPSPTNPPTGQPTPSPTNQPTPSPTNQPTPFPTNQPTPSPTNQPTPSPTNQPTPVPTNPPTELPTDPPTPVPTNPPTEPPTNPPTPVPTNPPTQPPTPPPVPTTIATVTTLSGGTVVSNKGLFQIGSTPIDTWFDTSGPSVVTTPGLENINSGRITFAGVQNTNGIYVVVVYDSPVGSGGNAGQATVSVDGGAPTLYSWAECCAEGFRVGPFFAPHSVCFDHSGLVGVIQAWFVDGTNTPTYVVNDASTTTICVNLA